MNDIKLDNNGDFDLERGDFLLIDNDTETTDKGVSITDN